MPACERTPPTTHRERRSGVEHDTTEGLSKKKAPPTKKGPWKGAKEGTQLSQRAQGTWRQMHREMEILREEIDQQNNPSCLIKY